MSHRARAALEALREELGAMDCYAPYGRFTLLDTYGRMLDQIEASANAWVETRRRQLELGVCTCMWDLEMQIVRTADCPIHGGEQTP